MYNLKKHTYTFKDDSFKEHQHLISPIDYEHSIIIIIILDTRKILI